MHETQTYGAYLFSPSILLVTAGCYEPGQVQTQVAILRTNQMVPNSYLVRWNGQVLSGVSQNINFIPILSWSLVFSGVTKETVEKTILAKHNDEFLIAEPEYQITKY